MNRILAHTSIIGTFSVATSSNTLFLIRNDGNVGIGSNPIDYTKVFIDHTYPIEPPPSQFIVGTFLKTTATYSENVHPLRVGIGDLLEPYGIEANAPTQTSTIFSYFNATSSVGDNDTSLYGGVLYRTGESKVFGLDVKIRGANKDSFGGRVNVSDATGQNIGYQSTISGSVGSHIGSRNIVTSDTDISKIKYGVYNTVGGDASKNYGTYNQITFNGNVSERYGTYNFLDGEDGEGTASYNFGVYNLLTSNYQSENVGIYTSIGKPGDSGYLNVGEFISISSNDSTNIGLYINVVSTIGSSQSAIIVNNGSSTFNDGQNQLSDFTIRSQGESHMFFVDSSTDSIGIGTASPSSKLQVSGTISTTGFRLTTNPLNEYILVSDSNGNGSWTASRLTTTAITTTGSTTTIATVSVPQGFTTIYEVYVAATSSNTLWGAWRREVVLTNFSGTANVVLTNSQLDKQSGLIPTNLSFTCSSSNLLVQVTGTTSQTVNWISKYQKII